jgi:hypothetical protein
MSAENMGEESLLHANFGSDSTANTDAAKEVDALPGSVFENLSWGEAIFGKKTHHVTRYAIHQFTHVDFLLIGYCSSTAQSKPAQCLECARPVVQPGGGQYGQIDVTESRLAEQAVQR